VEIQHSISGALVLAVDLSIASLCYAKRKCDELGLFGLEFGQADLLSLDTLGRSFDVIECGGVLHHLADPFEGWRALLSILRPDGVMRVALYSALARRDTAAAQEFVARHGYARTADDIRRARQDILALPEGEPARTVAASPDFSSTSTCRDLLFHVQEHRLTLPQIAEFLLSENLRFLGFDIDRRIARRYAAQFPEDRARTDLGNWHAFERDNPDTFGGMYQFWVQRRV
jgi:SAM-dependent methyltransferase